MVEIGDGAALGDDNGSSAKVHVQRVAECGPSGLVAWSAALENKISKDKAAILLYGCDVAEPAVTLLFEHGGRELFGRLNGGDWWVESVEHSNGIVLVEGWKLKLVDENLAMSVSKQWARGKMSIRR